MSAASCVVGFKRLKSVPWARRDGMLSLSTNISQDCAEGTSMISQTSLGSS
jgi:hypothetical protein